MKDYTQALIPENTYHIFNHAVSNDNLFTCDRNYLFFLKKYAEYIEPVADTFAYCLMPNHFHFAVRIKDEDTLLGHFKERKTLPEFQTLAGLVSALVSKQFSHFFNSYTQSFNKKHERKGTLFRKPFRRLRIDSEQYLRELISYIHNNPIHHGFADTVHDWKYSSFESYFSDKASLLKRDEIIDLFSDKENFYTFHQKNMNGDLISEFEF